MSHIHPGSSSSDEPFSFNVRLSSGDTIILTMSSSQSISELKAQILSRQPTFAGKRLRVISRGRVVDDSLSLSQANITPGCFVHIAATEAPAGGSSSTSQQQQQATASSSSSSDPFDRFSSARGFDRLLEAGFSAQDVHVMRMQFHASRSHQLEAFLRGQITEQQMRELEEQWMNSEADMEGGAAGIHSSLLNSMNNNYNQNVGPAVPRDDDGNNVVPNNPNNFLFGPPAAPLLSPPNAQANVNGESNQADTMAILQANSPESILQTIFAQSVEGDNFDFLIGIILGFLLAFLALLGAWEKSVTRKMKLGILAGIGCNFSFSLLRFFLALG